MKIVVDFVVCCVSYSDFLLDFFTNLYCKKTVVLVCRNKCYCCCLNLLVQCASIIVGVVDVLVVVSLVNSVFEYNGFVASETLVDAIVEVLADNFGAKKEKVRIKPVLLYICSF